MPKQTRRALRDRLHPYHTARRETGAITVLDLNEANSVTRTTPHSLANMRRLRRPVRDGKGHALGSN